MSTIGDILLCLCSFVIVVFNTDNYMAVVCLQGCVFEYRREDAIKERQAITDALYHIIRTEKHAGMQWKVNVITKKVTPHKRFTRKRCRTVRKQGRK